MAVLEQTCIVGHRASLASVIEHPALDLEHAGLHGSHDRAVVAGQLGVRGVDFGVVMVRANLSSVRVPPAVKARPGWAKALGAGVAALPPAHASPGHGSPGSPVAGEVLALNEGKPEETCQYFQISFQAQCRKSLARMPAGDIPSVKNFAIGYIAVDDKEALVGSTGIFCVPTEKPRCVPNHNPASIFSSGKSFKALWVESIASSNSSSNTYSLVTCEEVGGSWYVYIGPGS